MTCKLYKLTAIVLALALVFSFSACDDDDDDDLSLYYTNDYICFSYSDPSDGLSYMFYFDTEVNYFYYYSYSEKTSEYDSTSVTDYFRGYYTGAFYRGTSSTIVLEVEITDDASTYFSNSDDGTIVLSVYDTQGGSSNPEWLSFMYYGNRYTVYEYY